ncbi:FAD-dependent monooxygenase [Xylophilus ampelinus]|uniref:Salicylate hydroxylase n=1 Tax=Xylophilus ampelinus TaxID=54067 RepID=A0A318SCU8_9BURK|nr:FAD-dependent monooxygenase [Xylophilus ampelinus]MCS4511778.1 FAD-dependent monooxygenase [Xylophilus ampelinus]PYE73422.1 salicylate hydroxylase [Xylophilus ampelinus]
MSVRFSQEMLVVGGGIGGLAAAVACVRAGWRARVFEGADAFAEIGAGLQLGPNATRLLQGWGLGGALDAVAAFPDRLEIRSAASDRVLGRLALGETARARYGAPYATLHRADLHGLLLAEVRAHGEAVVHLGTRVARVELQADAVCIATEPLATGDARPSATQVGGDALVAADGLWSQVRAAVVPHDAAPRVTGHCAYRALLRQADLPVALRSTQLTVWLGPRLHLVRYPVRGGEWLNLVLLVQSDAAMPPAADPRDWSQFAPAAGPAAALAGACAPLRALQEAVADWRLWMLCDRPPVAGPSEMAQGRVALLGDASHPMLPYLAQGAGMAIEDAAVLGDALAMDAVDVPLRLRSYAQRRWQRVARVQAVARRNATVFHASGPVGWGRDMAMAVLGERLLDQPWLYGAEV